MSTQSKPYTPREIDDTEDRMGSVEQLDFSDRKDERRGRVGDERPAEEAERDYPEERVRTAGQTGGETLDSGLHEDGVSYDDASPETLLEDTGVERASDRGESYPADQVLEVAEADDIGGGSGLDEAELARRRPLDGKSWDGDDTAIDTRNSVSPDDLELSGDELLHSQRSREQGGDETT